MPVASVTGPERPEETPPAQTRGDVRVVSEVLGVVKGNEAVAGEWPITNHSKQRQKQPNSGGAESGKTPPAQSFFHDAAIKAAYMPGFRRKSAYARVMPSLRLTSGRQ